MPESDDYGIAETFAEHLRLALRTMHPALAFEAAQHATRSYLASHEFVEVQGKGAEVQYQMMRKRDKGGAQR